MRDWIVILMFVGCLGLAVSAVFLKDDKATSGKTLSLLGAVVTGYLGGKLAEGEKSDEQP
jgi:hypothetical protein